ncbi:MAG: efflux RND transporter periplasmic adaptor subunit [Crocinitomicaceae bacterium]|nr:efflux RND transporter periplasmic adaptor subunit [Crocinitomicaceae bacterium]
MSKTWKIILILLSVVIAGSLLAAILGKDRNIKEVSVDKVILRNIVETVSASGKIQPETEVKIQSEVSGQIIDLAVKEGDVVSKGQLLVRINPDLYNAALNRADATLNSAKSNLSSAKARLAQAEAQMKLQEQTYKRTKSLFEEKALSQVEMDNVTSAFETAKAEVTAAHESINSAEFAIASAEAGRNEASDNLRRTTILSPMAGTVTALTKEAGETVLGNNMMSGDVIMKVSSFNFMEVNVEVNESDIVRVDIGDTADVEVDAFRDIIFKGVVVEISNTAINALSTALTMDQVTNFSVKVRILRESYQQLCEGKTADFSPFRPGMSATVEIMTNRANNVLSVPIKSVASRSDTSSKSFTERMMNNNGEMVDDSETEHKEPYTVVFVINETTGKAEIRVVETGIQDDRFIYIKKGLNEGEKVITGPYEEVSRKLSSGDKVKIMEGKGMSQPAKEK